MIRFDSLAIAWLLLVAAFSGFADAARPKEQRRAVADPYLVLPPGTRPDDNFRPAPRDLGEREFVSSDEILG
jgi:lipase ATG15